MTMPCLRPSESSKLHLTVPRKHAWEIPLTPHILALTRVKGPTKSFLLFVMHLEQQLSIAKRYELLSKRVGVWHGVALVAADRQTISLAA